MPDKLFTNLESDRRLRGRAIRSTSVGTKLTAAERSQVQAAASEAGKAMSEWLRDAALDAACVRSRTGDHGPLLAEIVGVRLLLVNVLRSVATGQIIAPECFDKMLDEIGRAKHELAKRLASEGKK